MAHGSQKIFTMMTLPDPHTREELLHRLHEANERFHATRVEWEQWLAASEFRHEERVELARQKLRDAERDVLEAEEQIRRAMAMPSAPAAAIDRDAKPN